MSKAPTIETARAGLDLAAVKSRADFQLNIRAQIRRRWRDIFTDTQFIIGMNDAIQRGFSQAWRAGAAECGVKMSERTNAEKDQLQNKIGEQYPYISQFGRYIADNTKERGGKLTPLFQRADLWVRRYDEVRNLAKAMACRDKKLEWVIGVAEHCDSCLKLNGKVKRGSYWTEKGIFPRAAGAAYLECGGYNCQCTLVPTDKPITPGPLPRLP